MTAASVARRTISLADQLLPAWQELTKTEDARTLVAREIVNCLLDLHSLSGEYERLDVQHNAPV